MIETRGDALRVVAHLGSPLAGEPPQLDSLLVYVASRLAGKPSHREGCKIDRGTPCPDTSNIPIPIYRQRILGHPVAFCTSPILDEPTSDQHDYVCKRIDTTMAGLLAPENRKVVTTTNEWTKSYRIPRRARQISKVVWLCVGNRRGILDSLRYVYSIGQKVSIGYGRVSRWECERVEVDRHSFWPLWIDSPGGPVLMRSVPEKWDKIPPEILGAMRNYGSCSDPYWHPDRYTEILTPC